MSVFTKPYCWYEPSRYPHKGYAIYDWENRKTDRFDFFKGHQIPFSKYDLIFSTTFTTEKLSKYDCVPNTFGSPLVNGKVLSILEDLCLGDYQAFDAEIYTEDGRVKDYKILNLTHTVDSIDMENSICEYMAVAKNKIGGIINEVS